MQLCPELTSHMDIRIERHVHHYPQHEGFISRVLQTRRTAPRDSVRTYLACCRLESYMTRHLLPWPAEIHEAIQICLFDCLCEDEIEGLLSGILDNHHQVATTTLLEWLNHANYCPPTSINPSLRDLSCSQNSHLACLASTLLCRSSGELSRQARSLASAWEHRGDSDALGGLSWLGTLPESVSKQLQAGLDSMSFDTRYHTVRALSNNSPASLRIINCELPERVVMEMVSMLLTHTHWRLMYRDFFWCHPEFRQMLIERMGSDNLPEFYCEHVLLSWREAQTGFEKRANALLERHDSAMVGSWSELVKLGFDLPALTNLINERPDKATAAQEVYPSVSELAYGNTSVVYQIKHQHTVFAVKVMLPAKLTNPETLKGFENEVRMRRLLPQRYCTRGLPVTYFACTEKQVIISQWVDGKELNLGAGTLSPHSIQSSLFLFSQLEEKGLFEWDISPSNLVFTWDGHPHLVDVGVMNTFDPLTEFNPNGVDEPEFSSYTLFAYHFLSPHLIERGKDDPGYVQQIFRRYVFCLPDILSGKITFLRQAGADECVISYYEEQQSFFQSLCDRPARIEGYFHTLMYRANHVRAHLYLMTRDYIRDIGKLCDLQINALRDHPGHLTQHGVLLCHLDALEKIGYWQDVKGVIRLSEIRNY